MVMVGLKGGGRGKNDAMIGRLLRPLRSGTAKVAGNDSRLGAPVTINMSSPEFASGTTMPSRYRGLQGINPPIRWSNVPPGAHELVMVVEDVDVPLCAPLVHTILYAMVPSKGGIEAGDIPEVHRGAPDRIAGASLGKGSVGLGWLPVTPIPGHGPHRYVFQLFALDEAVPLQHKPLAKKQLLDMMAGHVIARGVMVGLAEA